MTVAVAASIVFWVALLVSACGGGATRRQSDEATLSCREAGYIGAIEDSGIWYCFRDRLGAPRVVPKP